MREEIASIDKSIADLEKKKVDTGVSDNDKKNIAEKIKVLQGDKEAISKGIENTRGVLVSGFASTTISSLGLPTQRSDQNFPAVAQTVENIVKSITDTDDFGQLCFSYMQQDVSRLSESAIKLQAYCAEAIELDQLIKKERIYAIHTELTNLSSSEMDSSKKAEEAKKLEKELKELNGGMRMHYSR